MYSLKFQNSVYRSFQFCLRVPEPESSDVSVEPEVSTESSVSENQIETEESVPEGSEPVSEGVPQMADLLGLSSVDATQLDCPFQTGQAPYRPYLWQTP